jgi:hypothetical protein
MLAVINGIEPRNQLEAMLAAQMAAVHVLTMRLASQLAKADIIPQQDSAERAFNKLTRTFVSQLEALKCCPAGPAPNKMSRCNMFPSLRAAKPLSAMSRTRQVRVFEKDAASAKAALPGSNVVPMPINVENKERTPVPLRRIATK